MRHSDSLITPVSGLRQASSVVTWGQQYIWHETIEPLGVHDSQENGIIRLPIPAECTPEHAAACIGTALSHFESLRTVYPIRNGLDRTLLQNLAGSVSLDIPIYTLDRNDPAQSVKDIRESLRSARFLPGKDLPLRAAIAIGMRGRASELLIAVSHLALDGRGAAILAEALREMLRSCKAAPAEAITPWLNGIQPIEQVEYENSDVGLASSDRSLVYWRRQLSRFASQDLEQVEAIQKSPYWRAWLDTDLIGLAAVALARQHDSLPMAVVVAAIAAVTAHIRQSDTAQVMIVCSNRITPGSAQSVMNFARAVPIVLELGANTFHQLIARANQLCLRAATQGACSPSAVEDLAVDLAGRQMVVDMSWIINPRLSFRTSEINQLPADISYLKRASTAMLDSARFRYRPDPVGQNVTAYFEASQDCLQIVASAAHFSIRETERILRCIARLFVEALASDFQPMPKVSQLY